MLPSGKALAVAFGLLCLAGGAYAVARETPILALRTIDVRGAPAPVAAEVRAALAPFLGTSLVSLDTGAVERRLDDLPVVARAHVDRSFPHALRVTVRPERRVAVLRRGPDAWLVSVRGRVMAKLALPARAPLPRIWTPATTPVDLGGTLSGDTARAVAALRPVVGTRFERDVSTVRAGQDKLTLVLRNGLKLILGNAFDLRVKLAVGQRVADRLGAVPGSVDLTMPQRPVFAPKSQPGG